MNLNDLIAYLLTPIAQVALIVGIAEVAKKTGLNKRFIPLLDLVLGIVCGILITGLVLKQGIAMGAIVGVAVGLSACGLFSGVKNIFSNSNKQSENDNADVSKENTNDNVQDDAKGNGE